MGFNAFGGRGRRRAYGLARPSLWVLGAGLVACLGSVASGEVAKKVGRQLVWPLDMTVLLTSGFGEYRPRHFHNGFDLSTGGAVGKHVRAVGDGEVTRVRASGVGYGRCLYIALDGGGMVVFGHLSRFAPRIAAYVAAEQDRAGRYEVDLYPPAGTFRVKKGELVAYSGESGAGPPHLHFEMRNTGGDVAMSPARFGYRIRDAIAPEMTEIIVSPASARARVAGRFAPSTLALRAAGPNRFVADTLAAWGPVALSVRALDRAEESRSVLPVYTLTLLVDGVTRYEARLDSVAYSHQVVVDEAYDPERARAGDDRVRRLYSSPGTRASGLDRHPGGILALDEDGSPAHEIEIVARDMSDNTTRARFVLLADEPPVIGSAVSDAATPARVVVDATDREGALRAVVVRDASGRELPLDPVSATRFAGASPAAPPLLALAIDGRGQRSSPVVVASPGGDEVARERTRAGPSRVPIPNLTAADWSLADPERAFVPVVVLDAQRKGLLRVEEAELVVGSIGASAPMPLAPIAEGPGRFVFPLAPAGTGPVQVRFRPVYGAGEGDATSVDLPLWSIAAGDSVDVPLPEGAALSVGARTLFSDAWVWVDVEPAPTGLEPGLAARSSVYELHPDDLVLRGTASLALRATGTDAARTGLYQRSDRGTWNYVDRVAEAGARGVEIRELGRYTLIDDNAAPRVARTTPREGRTVTSDRPWISVGLSDVGSGLHWSGLELAVDGKNVIAEWDPEAGELRGQPRWGLARGGHTARVTVRDRAGNSSEKAWRFVVSGRP